MSTFRYIWTTCFLSLLCTPASMAVRPRKVHVSYPIDLLGTNSDSYSGNLTLNKLTCFGNRDYGVPTYRETLMCMIRLPMGYNCHTIWGSRSVVVEVTGSVEFLKLNRLPAGSVFNEYISINATRWLELTASSSLLTQREVRHVPAEPIYLCARSNDWTGSPAKFHITFRPVFLREKDKQLCHSKTLVHIILVIAVTSIWLLPYIAAVVVAALTFIHGIKFIIAIITFSCCIVSLTPLMLTKKNRHLSRLYFNYFFTRIQAEETKMVFRQRLPVLQALFFSSALVCIGSGGSYIIYTYCGIDRELRNLLLKITIGIASSWFVFFLCRSFERFCKDWVWVPMSVCLAQLLDSHLNPLSRDEVVVSTLLISLGISLSFPRIARVARSKFPKGASIMAPRIKLWANKMRVRFLRQSVKKYYNDSVSEEYVSLAYKEEEEEEEEVDEEEEEDEDEDEGDWSRRDIRDSDSSPKGYETPRGYVSFDEEDDCVENDNIKNDYGNENDYINFEEIGIRRRRSYSALKESAVRSVHSYNCNMQLWEKLSISNPGFPFFYNSENQSNVVNPLDAETISSVNISHQMKNTNISTNMDSSHLNYYNSNSNSNRSSGKSSVSTAGFLNLFLGISGGIKNENENDKIQNEGDESEFNTGVRKSKNENFHRSPFISLRKNPNSDSSSSDPINVMKSNKFNDIERNREALSKITKIDLQAFKLFSSIESFSSSTIKKKSSEIFDGKKEIEKDPLEKSEFDLNSPNIINNIDNVDNINNIDNEINTNSSKNENNNTLNENNFLSYYNDNNESHKIGRGRTLFKHIVGEISLPLSVLGPLILNEKILWIPMISKNSILLNNLQNSLLILSESKCSTSLFEAEVKDEIFTACFFTSSYSDSSSLHKWIVNIKNISYLRSVAIEKIKSKMKENEIGKNNDNRKNKFNGKNHISEGDYHLSASVKGREVKVSLQIAKNVEIPSNNIDSDSDDDDDDDDDNLNYNHKNKKLFKENINVHERTTYGLEAMQSVVLAIVEEMNNMNCEIDSKSIQFCHSDNLENSNFRSISTVGVECGIESHVLNNVDMTADFLQIASQIFQSSNYFSKFCNEEFVKVLSAIIIPLGMDFTEVHKILKDLKIETFASSPIIIENGSKHPLNSNNSSSGTCNVQDRTDERVGNEFLNCDVPDDDEQKNIRTYDYESSINNKNNNSKTEIKNKNNTFSLSLLMPIFTIENDFNEESHSNKSNGSIDIDEVSIPSTGTEKSIPNRKRRKNSMKNSPNEIANLCYRLLSNEDEVVCSDKEQLNSCISKTLATVLLATFLSQLLDFAKSEFFTALMKKK